MSVSIDLDREWVRFADQRLVGEVDRYEQAYPGRLAVQLEIIEDLAGRLAQADSNWASVVDELCEGGLADLKQHMLDATSEYRSRIDWNRMMGNMMIAKVSHHVWREVAAVILEAEQKYFGRGTEANGYAVASRIVKNNHQPFKYNGVPTQILAVA